MSVDWEDGDGPARKPMGAAEWAAIVGSLLCGGIFLWGLWDVLLMVMGGK